MVNYYLREAKNKVEYPLSGKEKIIILAAFPAFCFFRLFHSVLPPCLIQIPDNSMLNQNRN